MATVIRERSSSIRIGRQFLSCSSLRVLLASHLLQEYFHIISISPHPSLACLLCMAHYKLGAGWWACPGLLFPAGWWLSPPPKGQSSSPFRLSCSISLLFWWIFVIMRFFLLVIFLGACLLSPVPPNPLECTALTLRPADLLCFPRPCASPLCAGQQGAGTQTGVTMVEDLLKNYNLPSPFFHKRKNIFATKKVERL